MRPNRQASFLLVWGSLVIALSCCRTKSLVSAEASEVRVKESTAVTGTAQVPSHVISASTFGAFYSSRATAVEGLDPTHTEAPLSAPANLSFNRYSMTSDQGAKSPDNSLRPTPKSGNLLSIMPSAKTTPRYVSTPAFESGTFSTHKFSTALASGASESPAYGLTSALKSGKFTSSKLPTALAQGFTKLADAGVALMSKSGTSFHSTKLSKNLARDTKLPLIYHPTLTLKATTALARDLTESADDIVTSASTSGISSYTVTLIPTPVRESSMSRRLPSEKPVRTAAFTEENSARPTVLRNRTSEVDNKDMDLVSYFGVGIAIVALFLAFLTFVCLRFKKTEHHFIHVNFVISLIFAQALFLFGVQRLEYKMACQLIAVALHYLYLAAFCWIALEGVMLYLILVKVFQTNIPLRRRKTVFFLCGWGIPVAVVGVTVALFYEEYGTENFCWLSVHSDVIWALAGPVLLVCLFNFLCLVKTFCVMTERRRLNQNHDRVAEIRFWAKGCAVLSCLLGISWMLGVFVVNESTPFMVYSFNAFNTLQGILIFILYCLGDEKIRAEYVSTFRCSKKRATYGLVRQQSKTDTTPNKTDEEACPREQETLLKAEPSPEPPKVVKDTLEDTSQPVACRQSPPRSAGKRASAASGEYKRVSQDVGSSKRQSREWACSWTPVEEDPEGSFAMDVFSTLKAGDGYRDLPVVDRHAAPHQAFGFPPAQNEFKSFKVSRATREEDTGEGRDSRVLKLYEDERSTVEAIP